MTNIKRRQYWVVVLFMIVCFFAKVDADDTINEIIKIDEKIQNLDKKIIKLMRFKMVKQPRYSSKLIFKANDNKLWLFKVYSSSTPVQNSIAAYNLFRLLGVETPTIYPISISINDELLYGAMQEFMVNAEGLYLSPLELSKEQVKSFQQHQILDYLIANPDCGKSQFLLDLNVGKIIGIDKDSSLYINYLPAFGDAWENSYYDKLWNVYAKNEITLNLSDSLQLIKYIQCFSDETIRKLLSSLFIGREKTLEQIIVRKNNLKNGFEIFYESLPIKNKKNIQLLISEIDTEEYSKIILKRNKKCFLKKQFYFEQLSGGKIEKQEDIKAVFHHQGWELMEDLYDVNRENILFKTKAVITKLKELKEGTSSVYQKFTLSLYIKQLETILEEHPLQSFFDQEFKPIVQSSQEVDLFGLESGCRISYGLPRRSFAEYKKQVEDNPENVLAHLNYIRGPIIDKEKEEILHEYRQKTKNNKDAHVYRLIYGLILNESTYFKKVNNKFTWKYLAKALIFIDEEDREQAIQECKKAIQLNKGEGSVFVAYMIKAILYEYDDQWIRFGEGFNIEEAVKSYKSALEIRTHSIIARLCLANLYLVKKLPQKALKEFKKIEEIDLKYAKENFHFENIKEENEYEQKEDFFNAVAINTLSGADHYFLGLGSAVKNNYKKAEEHFIKAEEFGYETKIKE